jgi:hypothetical protein
MRPLRLGLAALVVFLTMGASPALSAGVSTASCTGTWRVSFSSPGVGLAPNRVTFVNHDAALICVGSVAGSLVTGPGAFSEEGVLEGTCLTGTGSATFSVTVPTLAGPATLRNVPFRMSTGLGFGFKYSDSFLGPLAFVFVPTKGNCVTSAVTEIAVVAQFVLKS